MHSAYVWTHPWYSSSTWCQPSCLVLRKDLSLRGFTSQFLIPTRNCWRTGFSRGSHIWPVLTPSYKVVVCNSGRSATAGRTMGKVRGTKWASLAVATTWFLLWRLGSGSPATCSVGCKALAKASLHAIWRVHRYHLYTGNPQKNSYDPCVDPTCPWSWNEQPCVPIWKTQSTVCHRSVSVLGSISCHPTSRKWSLQVQSGQALPWKCPNKSV